MAAPFGCSRGHVFVSPTARPRPGAGCGLKQRVVMPKADGQAERDATRTDFAQREEDRPD